MKDVIKLKPTSCGYEEDEKGTEYYSYNTYQSMLKSLKLEYQKLRARLDKAREELRLMEGVKNDNH